MEVHMKTNKNMCQYTYIKPFSLVYHGIHWFQPLTKTLLNFINYQNACRFVTLYYYVRKCTMDDLLHFCNARVPSNKCCIELTNKHVWENCAFSYFFLFQEKEQLQLCFVASFSCRLQRTSTLAL